VAEERKKIRRPGLREYEAYKADLAIGYCPRIYACRKCGWPVIEGCCCTTCGDVNPQETRAEEAKEAE
jgi:hypothetical protein